MRGNLLVPKWAALLVALLIVALVVAVVVLYGDHHAADHAGRSWA